MKRPAGQKVSLLDKVLSAVGIAGVQVEAGENETGRSTNQFLERGPIPFPRPNHQGGIGLDHATSAS
jgi:hypothetical protein